ncbi:ATP-binding protein [Isoptericola jiangsuensis]|uniref:ATP-binding protein n=1 Tax=Isoptericola jiangsuensis TaxID=548579 RepID=UPI003AB061C5
MQQARSESCLIGSWTVSTVEELAPARSRLQEALCQGAPWQGAPAEPAHRALLQNIVLAASELMANALRHAGGPARLDVVLEGTGITVSVMDRSPDDPPVLSPDRELGEGGFGLQLTLRMADDVGWYRTTTGTKHVWARFSVPTPPGAAEDPAGTETVGGPSETRV